MSATRKPAIGIDLPALLSVAVIMVACGGSPTRVATGGSGGANGAGVATGGNTQGSAASGGATPGSTASGGGTEPRTASGGVTQTGGVGTGGAPATGGAGAARPSGAAGQGGNAAGGWGAGGARQSAGGSPVAAGGTVGVGGSSGGAAGRAGGGGGVGPACVGLVCEDFESGSIDPGKWETVTKGGTLAVEQQQVAHGKYAMQVHALAGSSDDWALLVAKNVPPALAGTSTFGRAYVYVAQAATGSIHVQMAFAGHDGTGMGDGPAPFPKLRYMEVASYSGGWQLGFDLLDLSPTVEEVSYPKPRVPTNRWACLEWQFEDHPDRVTIWVDGAQAGTFDNTNVGYASPGPVPKSGAALYDGTSTDIIGGFDTFGFGFHDWHPVSAFDLYYDDLVLDVKRVDCLP